MILRTTLETVTVSEDKQTDENCEHAEDELALKHQVGLRGLAYETCLQREDIDGGADDILSVAPSEGNRPRASPRTSSLKRCLTPPSTRTVKAA